MGIFKKAKKEKPSQEERILRTRLDLEKLRDRYEVLLETQRRILRKSITQKEKNEAEAKIRAGICSYTIVNEALRDLDEITSDIELTNSLKGLNRSLRAVNKLGKKASPGFFTKLSLDRQEGHIRQGDQIEGKDPLPVRFFHRCQQACCDQDIQELCDFRRLERKSADDDPVFHSADPHCQG